MEAPVLFICRNNGWAISTPTSDQFRSNSPFSYFPLADFALTEFVCLNVFWILQTQWPTGDGVVVKGRAYGIRSIRVDGNDALAMYSAVHAAREMAIKEQRPILIEVCDRYYMRHGNTNNFKCFFLSMCVCVRP